MVLVLVVVDDDDGALPSGRLEVVISMPFQIYYVASSTSTYFFISLLLGLFERGTTRVHVEYIHGIRVVAVVAVRGGTAAK